MKIAAIRTAIVASVVVAAEGPWDNESDKPQEKIAGVKALPPAYAELVKSDLHSVPIAV
jgi:hypothetical protein